MSSATQHPSAPDRGVFADLAGTRTLALPWRRTVQLCWNNIQHRRGRFVLVFVGIAVVVAFLMSSITYQGLIQELVTTSAATIEGEPASAGIAAGGQVDEVHKQAIETRALLERAGIFADEDSLRKQRDERIWLMALSSILCLVGITNTMLMSVTERIREIGTLKCLGALDMFIIRLFLIESLFIGVVGSFIGALFGFILTVLQVCLILSPEVLTLGYLFHVVLVGIPVAIGAGTVLTMIAAIYPTMVAARMKPVDAMRVEV